jgi:hypothetical protein
MLPKARDSLCRMNVEAQNGFLSQREFENQSPHCVRLRRELNEVDNPMLRVGS